MSPALFVLVTLGGGVGAVLRFVVDVWVMRRSSSGFPWGTFAVNTTGSLLLGLLTGLSGSVLDAGWLTVLGAGMLGGYTTFSTALVDTVLLLQRRAYGGALWNALGMLLVTVLAAAAGLALGRSL